MKMERETKKETKERKVEREKNIETKKKKKKGFRE